MYRLICGDAIEEMRKIPPESVNLVFGSPPYEDARVVKGDPFPTLRGQAWIDWMVQVYTGSLRISSGLVAFVVSGRTKNYQYTCTSEMLVADLHREGFNVRRSYIYKRYGIAGGGGPDWHRNDYETVVCVTRPGKLLWSDNTAMGHPPKYGPGGDPSHRKQDGTRTGGRKYTPPRISNPGNVIDCGAVGGGHLGDPQAHANEAPFPEALAEFFIRSFCPPQVGTVLDPFSGSGTTAAVALKHGRNAIGIDIRQSQIDLALRRLEVIPNE